MKTWRSDSSADKRKRKGKKTHSKFNSTDISNEAGIIEENETQNRAGDCSDHCCGLAKFQEQNVRDDEDWRRESALWPPICCDGLISTLQ
jgi:hypothetical protein